MKALAFAAILIASFPVPAHADPVLFHPGTGVPNPGQGSGRDVYLSEPPDLNGMARRKTHPRIDYAGPRPTSPQERNGRSRRRLKSLRAA